MSERVEFRIDIPPFESLSDEQKAEAENGYPVFFPTFDDAVAFARVAAAHERSRRAKPEPSPLVGVLASELARGLVTLSEQRPELMQRLAGVLGQTAVPDGPGMHVPASRPKRDDKPPPALPDDAIVDQRSAPVPKDLYLRLARQKAFPSRKIGKRIVAMWGDVKAAFGASATTADPPQRSSAPRAPDDDGLDDLRRTVGLTAKGK